MNIFADLDGTITESRQVITPEMKEVLKNKDVVVISGAELEQMLYQLNGLPCEMMSQNGNNTDYWQNDLTHKDIIDIHKHIDKLKEYLKPYSSKVNHIENRGCQVSLSFTGHSAPIEFKKKFDPTGELRQEILKKHPFKSSRLTVRIGGTTCLDYFSKNGTKGKNIERYIKLKRLKKEDCIYYGDALFKGGNDESVVGVIPTIAVKNPSDLLTKLK